MKKSYKVKVEIQVMVSRLPGESEEAQRIRASLRAINMIQQGMGHIEVIATKVQPDGILS